MFFSGKNANFAKLFSVMKTRMSAKMAEIRVVYALKYNQIINNQEIRFVNIKSNIINYFKNIYYFL